MSEPKLIYSAMAAIMRDIEPVGKDRDNTFQKFKFRGIEDIYAAASKAMAKHKVFAVPEVISSIPEERATKNDGRSIARILLIRYTFYAEDGSSVSCVVQGEGADTSDKASNKAMAAAHKYALTQTFVIPYSDMDDGDKDDVAHAAEKKALPKTADNRPTAPTLNKSEHGGPVVRFGKYKDTPLVDLSLKNLEWYRDAIKKSVDDPEKAAYRDKNQQHLDEIEEAIAYVSDPIDDKELPF